jgi:hypothetical protein
MLSLSLSINNKAYQVDDDPQMPLVNRGFRLWLLLYAMQYMQQPESVSADRLLI